MQTYDIDIAHRQYNPGEKRKEGKNYIPSIYFKLVNRFLANEIFRRRDILKNFRNRLGGKFSIERNMTKKRKQLWENVETKLGAYTYKWITNGDIFVKRSSNSRRIKIVG